MEKGSHFISGVPFSLVKPSNHFSRLTVPHSPYRIFLEPVSDHCCPQDQSPNIFFNIEKLNYVVNFAFL